MSPPAQKAFGVDVRSTSVRTYASASRRVRPRSSNSTIAVVNALSARGRSSVRMPADPAVATVTESGSKAVDGA